MAKNNKNSSAGKGKNKVTDAGVDQGNHAENGENGESGESGDNSAPQNIELSSANPPATFNTASAAADTPASDISEMPAGDGLVGMAEHIAAANPAAATVLEQDMPAPGSEPELPRLDAQVLEAQVSAPAPESEAIAAHEGLAANHSPMTSEAENLRSCLLNAPPDPMQNAHAAKAGREHQRQQAQSIMARVQQEADSLSPELRKHLGAHVLANRMHDLNKKCFDEIQNFKSVSLTFYTLRANSKAFLSLRPDQMAIWSEGSDGNNLVGLGFGTSTAPTLYLRNFLINAREMFLETYQDCSEIVLTLYVRTNQKQIKGRIDLPPGASITLQSRCDRCNIIGLSSFALDLE